MTVLQTAQRTIAAGNQDAPGISVDAYKIATALLRAVELLNRYEAYSKERPQIGADGCMMPLGAIMTDGRAFLAEMNKETT